MADEKIYQDRGKSVKNVIARELLHVEDAVARLDLAGEANATGDIYYRGADGNMHPLAIDPDETKVLGIDSGLPAWKDSTALLFEINLVTGVGYGPAADTNSFVLKDCDGEVITDVDIELFADERRVTWKGVAYGFTFEETGEPAGTITRTHNFFPDEAITVKVYKKGALNRCPVVPAEPDECNFEYDLDFDFCPEEGGIFETQFETQFE